MSLKQTVWAAMISIAAALTPMQKISAQTTDSLAFQLKEKNEIQKQDTFGWAWLLSSQ